MNAKIAQGIMIIFLTFLCLNIAQGAEKKREKTMQKDQKDNVSLPTVKRYDVESAQIKYKIKGDFGHGSKTILFTDWGLHELDVEQQDGAKTKSINIIDADFSYSFGTSDKEGLKSTVEHEKEWRSDSGLDFSAWTAKIFKEHGFESSGTRIVAGKTCDVWKQNPMIICVWKGVTLYFESSTPDKKQKSIIEAVKVDESPAIAKDAFTVPADIKFRIID